jgi:tripartite-type tricarboxylate transporter receptor subunit TctC
MRLGFALSAIMSVMLASGGSALPAEYPTHPMKVVVPFAAGGFMDTVARIATQRLSASLDQPVIVENRGGAGGKIGEEFVTHTEPDGYTLLIDIVTRPTLMRAVNSGDPETIDIEKAFVPIGPIGSSPMVMSASPDLGVKDFASFVEKLRSGSGKQAYGSAGVGTPSHIVSAQLVRELGLKADHAPYRGGAPALQDVAAGVISWMVDTPTGSLPLIQAGSIIPLFVVNPTRIKQLPDVPTLSELGYVSFRDEIMAIYLLAPAGTPKAILEQLSAAIMEVERDPTIKSRLETIAIEPSPPTDLQTTRTLVHEQIEAWEKAVKQANEPALR